MRAPIARPAWTAWRTLSLAQWREQPLRCLITVLAIAIGVSLGTAVYLVFDSALTEFNLATGRLIGSADIVVRGAAEGYGEDLFVRLAHDPEVRVASPVLELRLAVPGQRAALHVVALDPFRAAALQPALLAQIGADITPLLQPDAIVLSRAAAEQLGVARFGRLSVMVGSTLKSLRVIDVMPDEAGGEAYGIMDIGSAQWSLDRVGRIDRIDLRLRADVSVPAYRTHLAATLPPGIVASTPQIEDTRAASATRAFRVNLNMLALVALLTSAFLVFSTQSLAVLRRRVSFGLLRALGVTAIQLQRALVGEGIALGLIGSLLGVSAGALIAALALRYLGASFGGRQFAGVVANLGLHVWPLLIFLLLGTTVSSLGAWIPAREAARRAPALALKAGDVETPLRNLSAVLPALALLLTGAVVAWLPPVSGIPLPGYLAIAELLAGSVLLVPALMQWLTGRERHTGHIAFDTALAQLRGNVGLATISLASIIVSFSLMVAMAIMVHSFRDSFELWLVKLLPADLQLRTPVGTDDNALSAAEQSRLDALPGVARSQFQRSRTLLLRPDRAPVTLIARAITPATAASVLSLLQTAAVPTGGALAWISEAIQDQYGYHVGDPLPLPLGSRNATFLIAGVWRDYAHAGGSIVIARSDYVALTGDTSATEASLWRTPQVAIGALESAIRSALPRAAALELMSTPQLRQRSLLLFDRTFAITYALEAIAVAIGLMGVSVTAGSTALARRAQFGVLRHLGLLRRQIQQMLAVEGVMMSTAAVAYGLLLGWVLSLILVYVVNRQSFSWSIDFSVPWLQLTVMSVAMILASVVTAVWSGRSATSQDAIRAVREDW